MGEIIDLDIAMGKFRKEGIAVAPLEFNAELDITWERLDDIITRIGDIEDIPDFKMRESMTSKLREINERLNEIREHLAGKEI